MAALEESVPLTAVSMLSEVMVVSMTARKDLVSLFCCDEAQDDMVNERFDKVTALRSQRRVSGG